MIDGFQYKLIINSLQHVRSNFGTQNMSQDRCSRAANILSHTDLCSIHLRMPAFAAQLLDYFHKLIHPRRADWVTAGF